MVDKHDNNNVGNLTYHTFIALIMSLGPVTSGSNSKCPLLVAKATEAINKPGFFIRVDSIRFTQEEHVIPLIWKKKMKMK